MGAALVAALRDATRAATREPLRVWLRTAAFKTGPRPADNKREKVKTYVDDQTRILADSE